MDIGSIESPNNRFEKFLNIAGYVPVIGTLSGITRIIYGIAKIAFANYKSRKESENIIFDNYRKDGWEQINKGLCELPPFLSILLLRQRVTHKEVEKDNDAYNAELKGGKFTHFSSVKYSDGSVYVGPFSKNNMGMPSGKGTLTLADKTVYKGTFLLSKFPTEGTITYANKDVYTGAQKEGEPDGAGQMKIHGEGSTFMGEWENGELLERTYIDGSLYKGGFSPHTKHKPFGNGTLTLVTGECYEGAFNLEQFPMVATKLTYSNGDIYVGNLAGRIASGQGSLNRKGEEFTIHANFEDGKIETLQKIVYETGNVYVGEVDENYLPHGNGTLTHEDGDELQVEYVHGELKDLSIDIEGHEEDEDNEIVKPAEQPGVWSYLIDSIVSFFY